MNSRLFSQYRIDIKKLIRIATPIGLAQLAQTGMGTVDVIMAGGGGVWGLSFAAFCAFWARIITRLASNNFLFKWIWTTPSHCSPSETRSLDFIFSDDSPCAHHLS
jgi:hypothetical protein